MEKQKISQYKTTGILNYVFSALAVLCGIGLIIFGLKVLNENFLYDFLYEEAILDGRITELEIAQFISETGYEAIILGVFSLIDAVVGFILAPIFMKLSNITLEEANSKYKTAVTGVVLEFFFGGLICAILALLGLNKQKEMKLKYLNPQTNQTNKINSVDLDAIHEKLVKLNELKDAGAITEEEYNSLRETVMAPMNIKKEEGDQEIKQVKQRLEKIEQLKEMGAITEEEYNSLREKIIKEN